jgi:hypothetical protein
VLKLSEALTKELRLVIHEPQPVNFMLLFCEFREMTLEVRMLALKISSCT